MPTGVLVVDDSGYMRNRVKAAFESLDRDYYVVAEAGNGAEAVQQYKRHADDVDVVNMDIVMEKANGLKATSAIKQIDPEARVVMLTSVGQRKKMKLAAKAGADGYVTKPFDEGEIRTAIDRVGA
jgi:two-component system chemotaxis response regulator CheY